MNPDPTVIFTCDDLVEFTNDSQQPEQGEPEVVVLPPPPHGTDSASMPGSSPEPGSSSA
jgi:hypothetical protein